MPQILIDTSTDTGPELTATAEFLLELAAIRNIEAGAPRRPEIQPLKLPPAPPIVPVPPAVPLPPAPPLPPSADVPAGTLDPAVVFQKATPVSPSAPVAPVAPNGFQAPPVVATAPAVTPAFAPAVVTQPTFPATSAAGTASDERDVENLPWDARIHSETKKKNSDGRWRMRRNLDDGIKNAVYAELKALHGGTVAAIPAPPSSPDVPSAQVSLPQPPAGVPSGVPVPPEASAVPQPPVAPSAVPLPPVPAAGHVPAPPPNNVVSLHATVPVPPAPAMGMPNAAQQSVLSTPVTGFRELMQKVNTALANGRLTQDQLTEACKSVGMDGVGQLAVQPALVPDVDRYLNRFLTAA